MSDQRHEPHEDADEPGVHDAPQQPTPRRQRAKQVPIRTTELITRIGNDIHEPDKYVIAAAVEYFAELTPNQQSARAYRARKAIFLPPTPPAAPPNTAPAGNAAPPPPDVAPKEPDDIFWPS